jgi:hypothetical protein
MSGFDFAAVLAAQNGNWIVSRFLIFVAVTLLLTILRKVAESREKAIRANTATKSPLPAAPPKKENPFRNEIEAFLEEVGKRRSAGERPGRPPGDRGDLVLPKTVPALKAEPARKPVTLRPVAATGSGKPEPVKTVVLPAGPPARPGEEIAARKAPGSEDLGKQIRSHLAQYLDASRMAVQTQSDLGNGVDRTVRQHLGEAVAAGLSGNTRSESSPIAGNVIAPLLRNPQSVRTAIVINEILGPPRGLRRRP